MQLKKLHISFYEENLHLTEVLDFDPVSGGWDIGKVRGHGIVKIEINDLIFAIPVRSNIKHKASFILEVNRRDRAIRGMGLDYSKAMLIRKQTYISDDNFVLRSKEAGKKLKDLEEHITKQFSAYVEKYVKAVRREDRNVLSSIEYRFTTLVNYHEELGING